MKFMQMTALSIVLMAGPAFSADIEVSNSWVSGGEAAGKQVVIEALKKRGFDWTDASIAGYDNEQAAFMARVQAGDPPGAKMYIAGRSAEELIKGGLMFPIDDAVAASGAAAHLPKLILDAMTQDGKYYYAPISVHGESWYFYSKPAMSKIGYTEVPKDWDGFFAMLDAAKKAGITPVAFSGQSWQTNKVLNQILVSTLGAANYNKMLQHADATIVNSPEFMKAVEIFDRLHAYVGEGTSALNWNDATAQVIKDEALLQFQGDWAKGEFLAANKKVGVDYGCAFTPGIDDMLIVVDSFVFPKVEGKQEAQSALAQTLLDPEVQHGFTLKKGSFPARTDVDMSDFDICAQMASEKMKTGAVAADMAIVSDNVVQGQLADLINQFWASPYDHEDFRRDFLAALSH